MIESIQGILLSRIGVIEPGMIGVMRPVGTAPKRDFEGFQGCVFLPDSATAFLQFGRVTQHANHGSI